MCIYTHIHTCTHRCMYILIYWYINIYIYIHIQIHTCTYICTLCIHMYMYRLVLQILLRSSRHQHLHSSIGLCEVTGLVLMVIFRTGKCQRWACTAVGVPTNCLVASLWVTYNYFMDDSLVGQGRRSRNTIGDSQAPQNIHQHEYVGDEGHDDVV